MIVDTSAVLAIFQKEQECVVFARAVADAPRVLLSAVNYTECAIVIQSRYGAKGETWFGSFMVESNIEIVPVDSVITKRARRAYSVYGRGNHPAKLNLADVFAYALAKSLDEPLLFKGNGFRLTDVKRAL